MSHPIGSFTTGEGTPPLDSYSHTKSLIGSQHPATSAAFTFILFRVARRNTLSELFHFIVTENEIEMPRNKRQIPPRLS